MLVISRLLGWYGSRFLLVILVQTRTLHLFPTFLENPSFAELRVQLPEPSKHIERGATSENLREEREMYRFCFRRDHEQRRGGSGDLGSHCVD